MEEHALALLSVGLVLLASLGLEILSRKTRLPRVTLLLLFGVAVGPGALGLVPAGLLEWYPLVATAALGMIGFLLGGALTRAQLRKLGHLVAWVSLVQVVVTYAVVALGLFLMSVPLPLALLLAAIATATDPAATQDVIEENGVSGNFASLLQGVVAIDDAWGLIVFSLSLVVVQILLGGGEPLLILQHGFWELAGALMLGLLLGIPVAYTSGRLNDNRPLLVEALGAVLLCVGLALWLEVSYLLACVTMGCVVANLARHHRRPFRVLEEIEWPFAILFFVMSGTLLSREDLALLGGMGIGYILFRFVGRLLGGWMASLPAWTRPIAVRWMGIAMLPQAGVAMAMAFVAAEEVADARAILPVVIASTVLFELLGPILTRYAVRRADRATVPPR